MTKGFYEGLHSWAHAGTVPGMTQHDLGRSCHSVKNHHSGPKSSCSIQVRRCTRSLSSYGGLWNFQLFDPSPRTVIYHLTAIPVGIPSVVDQFIFWHSQFIFHILPSTHFLSASSLAGLEIETDTGCVLLRKSPLRF